MANININAKDFFNKGVSLFKLGQTDDALIAFNEAVNLNPDFAEAYYYRGFLYQTTYKYIESINDFEKAIKLKPDYAEAWFCKALSLGFLNDIEGSLYAADKAIEINPYFTEALLMKERILSELNEQDKIENNNISEETQLNYETKLNPAINQIIKEKRITKQQYATNNIPKSSLWSKLLIGSIIGILLGIVMANLHIGDNKTKVDRITYQNQKLRNSRNHKIYENNQNAVSRIDAYKILQMDYYTHYLYSSYTPVQFLHEMHSKYVNYVSEEYLHGDSGYWQDPYVTMLTKKGDCKAYAMLFIVLMRLTYGISPELVIIGNHSESDHAVTEWEDTIYDLTWNEAYPESQLSSTHPGYYIINKYNYNNAVSMINYRTNNY